MSTTVTYKGSTLATVENAAKTLKTAGKYMEGDVTLTDVSSSAPTLQAKGNIAPSTSSQTITPDAGYDGLSSVQINAMPNGSATVNASVSVTPHISLDSSTGVVSSVVSEAPTVTPSVNSGYIASGTQGYVTVDGTNTLQLTTQAAQTITPTTTSQTIASGKYLTGTQTILGDANLVAENIKDGVAIFGVTGTYSGGGGGGGSTVTITIQDSMGLITDVFYPTSATWSGFDLDPNTGIPKGTLVINENDMFVIAKTTSNALHTSGVTASRFIQTGSRIAPYIFLAYSGTTDGTISA